MSEDGRFARLLDAWNPAEDAGDPVGCLATSFTFDAAFFEDECLARFVRMETDPDENAGIYLLEREEKLAELAYAGCIVDAHHCRGSRSLRWDLLRAHVPRGGVMHAKLAVLHWTRRVRILVASANLTPNGYRRNLEVFGAMDFHDGADTSLDAILAVIAFVRDDLLSITRAADGARARAEAFLGEVITRAGEFELEERSESITRPLFVAPGQPDLVTQIAGSASGTGRFDEAHVASPFFDRAAGPYKPAQEIWKTLLRRRGEAGLAYHVAADWSSDGKPAFLHAPENLLTTVPASRPDCWISVFALPVGARDHRELHAKCVWLESGTQILYLVGSSNFTSAGYGLGQAVNVEANLLYAVRRDGNERVVRALELAFPASEPIADPAALSWQPADATGIDEPEQGAVPIPNAFGDAVFDVVAGHGRVQFTFNNPPAGWSIHDEISGETILDEARCAMEDLHGEVNVPWTKPRPPTGFVIRWSRADGEAWWPVTIASGTALPPPEELRDLPLDVLLDVLTSARPLHRNEALRRFLARRGGTTMRAGDEPIETDPHKQVDTSTFLLQRTRRLSWALAALRERLERPFPNRDCLEWRLRGPIGVTSVAAAIAREARSTEEHAFLVAELILELRRTQPAAGEGCLAPEEVRAMLLTAAEELQSMLPASVVAGQRRSPFARYLQDVIDAGTAGP